MMKHFTSIQPQRILTVYFSERVGNPPAVQTSLKCTDPVQHVPPE